MGVQFKALKYVIQNYFKKSLNKSFLTIGQFEFEYFGGSDVMNKLLNAMNEMSLENRTACIEMSDINGRVGSGSKTNSVDLCYSNVSGLEILKNPKYCKGLAFSIEERQILGEIFF